MFIRELLCRSWIWRERKGVREFSEVGMEEESLFLFNKLWVISKVLFSCNHFVFLILSYLIRWLYNGEFTAKEERQVQLGKNSSFQTD